LNGISGAECWATMGFTAGKLVVCVRMASSCFLGTGPRPKHVA
jgi:hypothetical protein